ncbi:MAG: hypothetical protein ACLUR5_12435 [Eubacterium ventriosum]
MATRKEYYWEHFGLMSDEEYAKKAIKKNNMYENNGFILGENLIATFELEKCPLDTRNVEKIIRNF